MEIKIKRNQINISPKYYSGLVDEFQVTRISIYNALNDVTKSPLAKRIRTRAMEILQEELKQAKI